MNDDALVEPSGNTRSRSFGLLAGLLLLIAVMSGVWSTLDVHLSGDAIDRAKATAIGVERLLSTMKDLETGQRGFLLTGDDSYLEPYRAADARIGPELDAMAGLDVDLPTLRRLVDERRAIAARVIARFQSESRSAGTMSGRIGEGKAAMDRLRAVVAETQARADALIQATIARDRLMLWPFELLTVGATLAAFALIAHLAARRRAEQRAEKDYLYH